MGEILKMAENQPGALPHRLGYAKRETLNLLNDIYK